MSSRRAPRKPARCSSKSRASTAVAPCSPRRRRERASGSGRDEKAAAYFERQLKYDRDIWIVEIEDREGRAFVDEKIV